MKLMPSQLCCCALAISWELVNTPQATLKVNSNTINFDLKHLTKLDQTINVTSLYGKIVFTFAMFRCIDSLLCVVHQNFSCFIVFLVDKLLSFADRATFVQIK